MDEGSVRPVSELAEERKSPSGKIIYGAILSEAQEELERSSRGLFWSGLAAGLSMGFSAIAMALLRAHLPDADWTPLVVNFGYSLGFLLVILGRQQLFTENTLTPILPLLRTPSVFTFFNVARLWIVVLFSNMIGALIIALVLVKTVALPHDAHDALLRLAAHAIHFGFGTLLLRGIFAGWLIALIVWLLPFAEAARIWIIIILTYIVSLGQFPHTVAGAVEAFTVAWAGQTSWGYALGGYLLPTCIGNAIGGVMLVAGLNHAQVLASGEKLQTVQEAQAARQKDTGLP